MIGIITEKNSAQQNFANALGGIRSSFNNEEYIITVARGHLYEYPKSPELMIPNSSLIGKYKNWNLDNLPFDFSDFVFEKKLKADASDVASKIYVDLKFCDEICIATDNDPTGEGQLIGWEIIDGLGLKPNKITRMYFVDETETEIQKAFVNRVQLPRMQLDLEYKKAEFRAKWDYMSIQFTRIATCCGSGYLLRQGRLKSTMVNLVGEALEKFREYKKVPFYECRFKDENGVVYSYEKEQKFPKEEDVLLYKSGSSVVVDNTEKKSKKPPMLIDLATLSAILSKHGIQAKTVLSVYQAMYEKNYVSYPRTEDKTISVEQFNELLPKIDQICDVVGIDKRLITNRLPRLPYVKNGGTHGANRPTKKVPKSLEEIEEKFSQVGVLIYTTLAKAYLAMMADDYIYEVQTGHLKSYKQFKGRAVNPISFGYKLILDDTLEEEVNEDEYNKTLGTFAKPFIYKGFPKQPPYPTMTWLMKQLEKYDVGTGATRTSIYAEVTNQSLKDPLLVEEKGKISMTPAGEESYKLIHGSNIASVKLTEHLMQVVRDVGKGKANPTLHLKNIAQIVMADIVIMKNNKAKFSIRKSANDNKSAIPSEKVKGIWQNKQITINPTFSGHKFTEEELKKLFNGEEIILNDCISSKTLKTYCCKGKLADGEYNGNKYVGFKITEYLQKDGIPDSFSGYKFNLVEKYALEAGNEIFITNVKSKNGSKYKCYIKYDMKLKKFLIRF